jgi:hypothetical protein
MLYVVNLISLLACFSGYPLLVFEFQVEIASRYHRHGYLEVFAPRQSDCNSNDENGFVFKLILATLRVKLCPLCAFDCELGPYQLYGRLPTRPETQCT